MSRATPSDSLAVRALTQLANGNVLAGLGAWRRAVAGGLAGPSPRILEVAAPVLAVAEGRGSRTRKPPAIAPAPPENAGWGLAWARDLDGVRRFVRDHPLDPSATGLLGVAHLLERRPGDALPLLDQAVAEQPSEGLRLHRARALIQLGRFDDARAALAGLGNGEALARRLLVALEWAAAYEGLLPHYQRMYDGMVGSETNLNGLFSTTLPAIVGRPALAAARESPRALVTLLEDVLDRMAGNLGEMATVADVSSTGARRYVPLAIPGTTRAAASSALLSLPYVGEGSVLAELDGLELDAPSVHARCYRGELFLWLGRYADAVVEFASANDLEAARWADIGKIAALVLTERHDEARALIASTAKRFTPIVGATLPVYAGMLHRRTGHLREAIVDLDAAVTAKPGRIGARVELCLALRRAGRRSEALEHAARAIREVAPLLVDVAEARGAPWWRDPSCLVDDALLEDALDAMRGNRSSSLVTWVDRSGNLRALEPMAELREHARNALVRASL